MSYIEHGRLLPADQLTGEICSSVLWLEVLSLTMLAGREAERDRRHAI